MNEAGCITFEAPMQKHNKSEFSRRERIFAFALPSAIIVGSLLMCADSGAIFG